MAASTRNPEDSAIRGFRLSKGLAARIRKEAALFHGARRSHDWEHTERVLALCRRIGDREGADLAVLTLAALLHDIGRAAEDRSSGRVEHHARGAALAEPILRKHGIPEAVIDKVLSCIRTHRFRKGGAPESLEAKVLYDADKLDSIGAVGIGRAFLFAGEVGARLHDKDIDVAKTKPYTRDDTAYREFLVKLRTIRDRMHTREGRRIARERHRFMEKFFERLNKEVDGEL